MDGEKVKEDIIFDCSKNTAGGKKITYNMKRSKTCDLGNITSEKSWT